MRYSHQRELIENIVKSRKDHPTADEIYSTVRAEEPTISLGTVYRNLKLLAEEGKVLTLETEDKKIHYDGDTSSHIHFICKECGKIFDLFKKLEQPKELNEMGAIVTDGKCVFYGICPSCNK